jgi:hypothetical protein
MPIFNRLQPIATMECRCPRVAAAHRVSYNPSSKQVEEDQAFFALVGFGPKENISVVLHVKSTPSLLKYAYATCVWGGGIFK